MPFTFVHPAVVLPISKHLGRFGVLSALVIGSMSPDFVYFAPIGIHGSDTHSVLALFWFCLPASLLVYQVFHRWLRQPLVSLLPPSLQIRIEPGDLRFRQNNPSAVLASLLLGAMTHLVWDSFTHAHSPLLVLRPVLEHELFAIEAYQVFLFRILQHASTALGTLFIVWWVRRWYLSAQPIYPTAPLSPSTTKVLISIAMTGVVAVICGVAAGLAVVGARDGLLAVQYFSVKAVVTAVPVFVVVFLGYCVWWHAKMRGALAH